ncbi:uncharacterized protein LOC126062963 isoform X2 [Elephas maximus indicus]|uniref:uncharacterized protein LOC126062963 isoform X2 n=1 Tax=Elephas maximus indicus TaxID=99487 RepID=UPI0021161A99|nr:uncharacterized protein LOC126062963 isoform X2 [Elephas maximus indicus]
MSRHRLESSAGHASQAWAPVRRPQRGRASSAPELARPELRARGAGGPERATDTAGAQDTALRLLPSRTETRSLRSCPARTPRSGRVPGNVGPEAADLPGCRPRMRVLCGMRLWGTHWGPQEDFPCGLLGESIRAWGGAWTLKSERAAQH